jgi:superfamily II DNA/RNA helicase
MLTLLESGRARARMPRTLILEPTRELAAQVAENFDKYGKNHKLNVALLIGGVSFGDQEAKLDRGVDVLIATPGRLLDQHSRGKILLSGVDVLVIDEADRMLDMGFIPDVEKICTLIKAERQTLLFSATMPAPIKKLADRFMTSPKMVEVARPATTNKDIAQWLMPAESRKKQEVLRELIRAEEVKTGIIFCNRKTTVRDLAASLKRNGFKAGQIHGDREQADRIRELDRFKDGEINILVASDVAARGLDIKGVSHVFNFDVPWHPDDYVHRIGRTGRAGQKGVAITLVTPDDAEAVASIEKLTGQSIQRRAPMADFAPEGEAGLSAQPRREKRTDRAVEPSARAPRKPEKAGESRVEPARERKQPDSQPRESRQRDRQRPDRQRPDRQPRERDDGPPIGPGFGEEGVPAFLLVSARA